MKTKKARKPPRAALLENVRRMLCEAETRDPDAPDLTEEEQKLGGRLQSGLRFHAAEMIASGHWQLSDLAGRYIREGSRETDCIISTARTQTEWLLSEPMRFDPRKNGVSRAAIDPSGQNAAVCAEARRRGGNLVQCLNPFGLHVARYGDMESAGHNPLANIDPRSRFFYQQCAAVGEALIKLENDAQVHFLQSARGLITGLVMWEVLKAVLGEE